jgi:hypothetical protein
MAELKHSPPLVSVELIEAIKSLPLRREVQHCGSTFRVASPFAIYTTCPRCGQRIKVRAFSAAPEVEDVFDAVFAWTLQPTAEGLAQARRQEIRDDADE